MANDICVNSHLVKQPNYVEFSRMIVAYNIIITILLRCVYMCISVSVDGRNFYCMWKVVHRNSDSISGSRKVTQQPATEEVVYDDIKAFQNMYNVSACLTVRIFR